AGFRSGRTHDRCSGPAHYLERNTAECDRSADRFCNTGHRCCHSVRSRPVLFGPGRSQRHELGTDDWQQPPLHPYGMVGGNASRLRHFPDRPGGKPDRRWTQRCLQSKTAGAHMNQSAVKPVLTVDGLSVEFEGRQGRAWVLNDISFEVGPGETLCLVGESGCGKSMTALAIRRLLPDLGSVKAGAISLRGEDLASYAPAQMRRIRGNKISMIFQEPMTALNPTYTVGN